MASGRSKIVALSVALAAIGGSAALTASAAAGTVVNGVVASQAVSCALIVQLPSGEELMTFVVGEGADGTVIADHSSHASHASHSSHSSHHSSRYTGTMAEVVVESRLREAKLLRRCERRVSPDRASYLPDRAPGRCPSLPPGGCSKRAD